MFSLAGLFSANGTLLIHGRRVAGFACAIAERMKYCAEGIEYIGLAAFLHDIGKAELPAEILNKPAALDKKELAVIRKHPRYGYRLLQDIRSGSVIADVALQHHERMDGSGYPRGLKGDQIMMEARILAVADVVEAMMSHRPYRAALGLDKALEEITINRGKLYDEVVVDACILIFKEKGFSFPE